MGPRPAQNILVVRIRENAGERRRCSRRCESYLCVSCVSSAKFVRPASCIHSDSPHSVSGSPTMAMPMHLYSQMLSEQKSAGQAPRPSSARLSGDQAATVQFLLKKIADAESRAKMAEHRAQRAEAALAVMGKGPPPPGASFKGHTLQQYRQAPGFSGNTPGSPNLMLRPHSPRSPRSGFPDRGASAPPARRAWAPQSPRREIFDTVALTQGFPTMPTPEIVL